MADIKYLHSEAFRIRQRAHDKLSCAYKATVKALSFNKASDYHKATVEGELANHLYTEAIQLEHEAMDIDHHAADLEIKAQELDKQSNELQMNIKSKLEMLDRVRRSIIGNY